MGLGLTALTLGHVIISLVGIASGFVVVGGLLTGKRLDGWTAVFLATTVATSASGFLFPFQRLLPSHAFAIVSLLVLPVALFARYRRDMAGRWRVAYVSSSVFALYLNVFVLVVQLFQKVPGLRAVAQTQTELPFAVTQGVVLIAFVVLGIFSGARFRPFAVHPVADTNSPPAVGLRAATNV